MVKIKSPATLDSRYLSQEDIILNAEPNNICTDNFSTFSTCRSKTWPEKFDCTIELNHETTLPDSLINNKIASYFNRLNQIADFNDTGIWAKTYSLLNENSIQVGQITFRPLNGNRFSSYQLNELDQIIVEFQRIFAGEGSVNYFPSEICDKFIEPEKFQRLWSFLPLQTQEAFESINDAPITAEIFNGHSEVAYLIRMAISESNLNMKQQNIYGYKGLYQMNFSTLKDIGVIHEDSCSDVTWTSNQKQQKCVNTFLGNPFLQINCIKKHWNNQFNNYLKHELEINSIDIDDILRQNSIPFNLKKSKIISKPNGAYMVHAGTYTIPATISALIAFIHLSGARGLADFVSGKWNDEFIDQHGTMAWNYAKKMETAPNGKPYNISGIIKTESTTPIPSLQKMSFALYREGRDTIQSELFQTNSYLPLQISWGNHANPGRITLGPKQGYPNITFLQPNANLKKIMESWMKALTPTISERKIYHLEDNDFLLLIEGAFAVNPIERIKSEFKKLILGPADASC